MCYFFRPAVQFNTTVNGTDALGSTGVTKRNRLPSGHVADAGAWRDRKERRRPPNLKLLPGGHVNGHHFPVRPEIKELAAIPTPAWRGAAAARHQHPASRAG